MGTKRTRVSILLIVAVALLGAPVFGSHVEPVLVAGNPDCGAIGMNLGFKIDSNPANGTYPLTSSSGVLTGVGWPSGGDPNNSVTIANNDGTYFDWSATLGIDAVIVKGGPNANVYFYDPEATSDTGLHSPDNSSGDPAAISHVEFCLDYEVDVAKTAETTFTRTWDWDIEKVVNPTSLAGLAGETMGADWTVGVDKVGAVDSDWAVSGTITIENNTPFDATVTSVADEISGLGSVDVDCGGDLPQTLVSGSTLSCDYGPVDLPSGTDRLNTATVGTSGIVGGGEAQADVDFGRPTTEVNPEVNVTDSNGMGWGPVGDDAAWTYGETFTCSSDPADYTGGHYQTSKTNVATITETGDSDDAHITVDCYAPVVSKDATTSFDRDWDWIIGKSADWSSLTLALGQTIEVFYDVEVDATPVDDNHEVTGTITVVNSAPVAMTVGLVDIVSPDIAATLTDCTSPVTVPAGQFVACGYTATLPDGTSRVNTATATLNGIDFSGSADVVFADPNSTSDYCVDISDAFEGEAPTALGTVCADGAPATFSYSVWLGGYETCGDDQIVNTASLDSDDGVVETADWTIDVNVPCEEGCTLTPGYWKTHSEYGPAPYDDTWADLPNGADTCFWYDDDGTTCGQTYYEVLWTPPQGGNAYYILAHAYIAAQLNVLNDASMAGDVAVAYDLATSLFYPEDGVAGGTGADADTDPADIAKLKGRRGEAERALWIMAAATLDAYNNGTYGPGHCSE